MCIAVSERGEGKDDETRLALVLSIHEFMCFRSSSVVTVPFQVIETCWESKAMGETLWSFFFFLSRRHMFSKTLSIQSSYKCNADTLKWWYNSLCG